MKEDVLLRSRRSCPMQLLYDGTCIWVYERFLRDKERKRKRNRERKREREKVRVRIKSERVGKIELVYAMWCFVKA